MALGPLPAVAAVPTLAPLPAPGAQDGRSAAGGLPPPLLQAIVAEPALDVLAQAARTSVQDVTGAAAPDGSGARGGADAGGAGGPADYPLPDALRLDQRALQQLAWRAPDAARLALSWRSTLLRSAGPRGGPTEARPSSGTGFPAGEAASLAPPLALAPSAPASRGAPGAPALLPGWINVYAWGGMQALLGVATLEAEEAPPPPHRRARVGALRFALEVPGLGRIQACLHLAGSGIALDLGAQTRALMQHVRDRLPALAAAFARAELPLARCRLIDLAGLERGLQASGGLPAGVVLAPTLFRAATELWSVLAPPLTSGSALRADPGIPQALAKTNAGVRSKT